MFYLPVVVTSFVIMLAIYLSTQIFIPLFTNKPLFSIHRKEKKKIYKNSETTLEEAEKILNSAKQLVKEANNKSNKEKKEASDRLKKAEKIYGKSEKRSKQLGKL